MQQPGRCCRQIQEAKPHPDALRAAPIQIDADNFHGEHGDFTGDLTFTPGAITKTLMQAYHDLVTGAPKAIAS